MLEASLEWGNGQCQAGEATHRPLSSILKIAKTPRTTDIPAVGVNKEIFGNSYGNVHDRSARKASSGYWKEQ